MGAGGWFPEAEFGAVALFLPGPLDGDPPRPPVGDEEAGRAEGGRACTCCVCACCCCDCCVVTFEVVAPSGNSAPYVPPGGLPGLLARLRGGGTADGAPGSLLVPTGASPGEGVAPDPGAGCKGGMPNGS